MKSSTFLLFLVAVVGVCCWVSTDAAEIGVNLRKNSKLLKSEEIVNKQNDDDEEGDEEKEYWTPHLYPHIIKLFATSLGANDTLVNKTVDQFVENFNHEYNGIKPTGTPILSPVPTAQVAAVPAVPAKAPQAAVPAAAPAAPPAAPTPIKVQQATEEKDEDEDGDDGDDGRQLFSL